MNLRTSLRRSRPIFELGNVIGKFATNVHGTDALKSDLKSTISRYNRMVSSAIWKKTCTSEFFKDDQNCMSPNCGPKDECNLKSLENLLIHAI